MRPSPQGINTDTRPRSWRLPWFFPCALTAAALGLVAPAQAAKKPDLVIAASSLQGRVYAFQGESGGMFAHDSTRNQGTARAGPSITKAYLTRGDTSLELGSRAVPGLGAAKQSTGDDEKAGNKYDYQLGPYYMTVCADATNVVQESNENNNCVYVRNRALETEKVFVIKRAWSGTLGGYAQRGFFLERYQSSNARIVFDKPLNATEGRFAYNFAGPVKYTDSGSNGFCTYSGGDTQIFGPGHATATDDIHFDYLGITYGGGASANGAFYTTHLDCGSSHVNQPGPAVENFLNFGDSTRLRKHLGGSIQTSGQTWTWSFD